MNFPAAALVERSQKSINDAAGTFCGSKSPRGIRGIFPWIYGIFTWIPIQKRPTIRRIWTANVGPLALLRAFSAVRRAGQDRAHWTGSGQDWIIGKRPGHGPEAPGVPITIY